MERNHQRPTQRSSNHKKNIPENRKKNTIKTKSSSQGKKSSEKTVRSSMEKGRKPTTRRRPVGPRDPRAARRAAMRRKRRRANFVFIIILLFLLFLLIRWAFARKGTKRTATSDMGTPAATTDATARRNKVLFRKPSEILYAIGETKPVVPTPSGKPENYGQEGDTPTGRTYQEDFRKDIFMGNSILDELQYYRYIYPDNSIAKIGLNVETAMEHIDEAVRRRPERVFLYFGTNEANGLWETETYINGYRALVTKLRQELPKSKIYVMSILPVDESLAAAYPETKNLKNETIRGYNEALQTMAQEEGIEYIDLYKIENVSQYHEEDGIHFQAAFAGVWLQYILETIASAAQ